MEGVSRIHGLVSIELVVVAFVYAAVFVGSLRLTDGPSWRAYQAALAFNAVAAGAGVFLAHANQWGWPVVAGWIYLVARGFACLCLIAMAFTWKHR